MDKIIEWALAQYGIFGVICLAILIILFKFSIPITSKLRSIFAKDYDNTNKPSILIKYKLIYWMDYKIQNIAVSDLGRKKILIDLLLIKFKYMKSILILPLIETDTSTYNINEITHILFEHVDEVNDKYKQESIELGIPIAVIDKFESFHSNTMEKFHMNCSMILQSNGIYKSNNDKIEAILSLIIVLLELTIVDVERTLSTLNGSLTGTKYKGVVCG